jgi:long-chain-alcohol oxidase
VERQEIMKSQENGKACLSPRQNQVLISIVEALMPPLSPPPNTTTAVSPDSATTAAASLVSNKLEQSYWEYSPSSDPVYLEAVQTAILHKMAAHDQSSLLLLLTLFSTAVGTSALTGTFSLQSLDAWTLEKRCRALWHLQHSLLVLRRKIFVGLKRFLCAVAYSVHNPTTNTNPLWPAMGFPGSPVDWQVPVVDSQLVAQAVQHQAPVRVALETSRAEIESTTAVCWDCDVIIVGSGSGGSVAANILACAGWRVVVLEKSVYTSPDEMAWHEAAAMDAHFEQHGLVQTVNGVVSIMAGSALGGGTAINWGCCLPLPDYAVEEWARDYGLAGTVGGTEYETALKQIMAILGATDTAHVTHNAMNRKLQEGCNKLNYNWSVTGQVGLKIRVLSENCRLYSS